MGIFCKTAGYNITKKPLQLGKKITVDKLAEIAYNITINNVIRKGNVGAIPCPFAFDKQTTD